MKCVQGTQGGDILRLRNSVADEQVRAGLVRYVPKKGWKAQRGKIG